MTQRPHLRLVTDGAGQITAQDANDPIWIINSAQRRLHRHGCKHAGVNTRPAITLNKLEADGLHDTIHNFITTAATSDYYIDPCRVCVPDAYPTPTSSTD